MGAGHYVSMINRFPCCSECGCAVVENEFSPLTAAGGDTLD